MALLSPLSRTLVRVSLHLGYLPEARIRGWTLGTEKLIRRQHSDWLYWVQKHRCTLSVIGCRPCLVISESSMGIYRSRQLSHERQREGRRDIFSREETSGLYTKSIVPVLIEARPFQTVYANTFHQALLKASALLLELWAVEPEGAYLYQHWVICL